ncbi:MAG: hypothetical protein HZB16_19705 [Armatimonadetes bacterium]|nr:hypothetical protein [Armatimonadota bacterium]
MNAILWLLLSLGAPSEVLIAGRDGQVFDAATHNIVEVAGRADYATLPLTVTCWARLGSADAYNILIANGDKSSPCHWEVFTMPGSGLVTAYLPGMTPDHVPGSVSLTDGVWHQVTFHLTSTSARLEVDGKPAGEAALQPKAAAWEPLVAGPLWFGGYPPGGLWFAGQLDDIALTQGERPIGRWQFEDADDSRMRDESPLANAGRLRGDDTLQPDAANYPFGLGGAPPSPAEWGPRCFGKGTTSVAQDWDDQWTLLADQISRRPRLRPEVIAQVLDPEALIAVGDRDPLDVVLRRTRALLTKLRAPQAAELTALTAAAGQPGADRRALYTKVCALRRAVALSNPLLGDSEVLFCARGVYWGHDQAGQHQSTQYFAFNAIPGGGLFAARIGYDKPVVRDLLAGRGLGPGAFATPDLDYDGRRLVFAYTQNRRHRWQYTPESTWHLATLDLAGGPAKVITAGAYNDFDPCWLPNGKLAFISERRGGYIRCFVGLDVRTYVLHEVNADGSGLGPLSYFETSEWNPSVNHDGQIVYSRWDYVDREDCLGSLFWQCYPDGRDPRAPHGNYPWPYHTFADNKATDTRRLRPMTELGIRAIPASRRYLLTAAPHHGEAYGSLCQLDLGVPDDGAMSQLRRVTPYADFPETETPGRRFDTQKYGTAWPLSEDFYLTNYHENLYLLDRWGNHELLVARADLPVPTDGRWRLTEPIPLRARTRPPILPDQRRPGQPATVRVANVYDSDLAFPPGTRIKWLRVVQDILKDNPVMDQPRIGYGDENTPRVPLGIAAVDDDGSVAFEAPAGKELIFQALDEHYMAVQSMRSVAYLQPGEELTCAGCHESKQRTPKATMRPTAFARPASKLQTEPGGGVPTTYHRLVRPIFEQRCVPCHREKAKGPTDMSYAALRDQAFHFAGGFLGNFTRPVVGGSRTIPGRYGARASKLGQALLDANHRGVVSEDDARRIILWLDCNSPQYGAFHDVAAQERGEVVWPKLDCPGG